MSNISNITDISLSFSKLHWKKNRTRCPNTWEVFPNSMGFSILAIFVYIFIKNWNDVQFLIAIFVRSLYSLLSDYYKFIIFIIKIL